MVEMYVNTVVVMFSACVVNESRDGIGLAHRLMSWPISDGEQWVFGHTAEADLRVSEQRCWLGVSPHSNELCGY